MSDASAVAEAVEYLRHRGYATHAEAVERIHAAAQRWEQATLRASDEVKRLHAIRNEFGEPADLADTVAELRAEVERLRERLNSCEAHYEAHNSDDYGAWLRSLASTGEEG